MNQAHIYETLGRAMELIDKADKQSWEVDSTEQAKLTEISRTLHQSYGLLSRILAACDRELERMPPDELKRLHAKRNYWLERPRYSADGERIIEDEDEVSP